MTAVTHRMARIFDDEAPEQMVEVTATKGGPMISIALIGYRRGRAELYADEAKALAEALIGAAAIADMAPEVTE